MVYDINRSIGKMAKLSKQRISIWFDHPMLVDELHLVNKEKFSSLLLLRNLS